MEQNFCVECKKRGIIRPVWKGTKWDRNYWQLYCAEHEAEHKRKFKEAYEAVNGPGMKPKQIEIEMKKYWENKK